MSEFLYGLALFKADLFPAALVQFERARQASPAWQDEAGNEQGTEILYLWIGSTFNELARQGEDGNTPCPIEGSAGADRWGCARAAYNKALQVNQKFARAHIGLGKLWSELAERPVGGLQSVDCRLYNRAVAEYDLALDPAMEAAATAYVDLKTHYNKGLTYAKSFRNRCDEGFQPLAVQELEAAIAPAEMRTKAVLAQEIAAKASYELGRVLAQSGQHEEAIQAFEQAIAIAEPVKDYEEDVYEEVNWRYYRWNAHDQLGHIYIGLAEESGDAAWWQKAIDAFTKVITRYKEGKYGDEVVVADAYFSLGITYNRTGRQREAVEPLSNAIALAENTNAAGGRSWDPLQGARYLELGQALDALARWAESIDVYSKITQRFETHPIDVAGADAAAASTGGSGL